MSWIVAQVKLPIFQDGDTGETFKREADSRRALCTQSVSGGNKSAGLRVQARQLSASVLLLIAAAAVTLSGGALGGAQCHLL